MWFHNKQSLNDEITLCTKHWCFNTTSVTDQGQSTNMQSICSFVEIQNSIISFLDKINELLCQESWTRITHSQSHVHKSFQVYHILLQGKYKEKQVRYTECCILLWTFKGLLTKVIPCRQSTMQQLLNSSAVLIFYPFTNNYLLR